MRTARERGDAGAAVLTAGRADVPAVAEQDHHTVAVVDLCMKALHEKDMGIVLASRIAETFASAGNGLICDQNDEWWTVEDGVPVLVLARRGNA